MKIQIRKEKKRKEKKDRFCFYFLVSRTLPDVDFAGLIHVHSILSTQYKAPIYYTTTYAHVQISFLFMPTLPEYNIIVN